MTSQWLVMRPTAYAVHSRLVWSVPIHFATSGVPVGTMEELPVVDGSLAKTQPGGLDLDARHDCQAPPTASHSDRVAGSMAIAVRGAPIGMVLELLVIGSTR